MHRLYLAGCLLVFMPHLVFAQTPEHRDVLTDLLSQGYHIVGVENVLGVVSVYSLLKGTNLYRCFEPFGETMQAQATVALAQAGARWGCYEVRPIFQAVK
jgi:hypothetical protein